MKISGLLVFYDGMRFWYPYTNNMHSYVKFPDGAVKKEFIDTPEDEVEAYRPEGFVFKDWPVDKVYTDKK